MYISKLIIKNYKSIKDEVFLFNKGINVLVGKNNSGKSNIVSALNELLSDKFNSSSYEDKIFYTNSSNQFDRNFKIVAVIDEIKNLDYSLLDNIKKSVELIDITDFFNEDENSFENEWVISDDTDLKEKYKDKFNYKGTNLSSYCKKDKLTSILSNTCKIWIYKYYNKDSETNIYNMILKVNENTNPFFEELINSKYYRMTYINPNIKATLVTSLLIPAFRSTETTLKISKWSWYGKLLQRQWEKSCTPENENEIKQASSDLKAVVGKVYSDLKTNINEQLQKTLSLMNISIDINMLESKKEDYYKSIVLSVNDGIETSLDSKGSGLQSLIMIELFKFYCKVFNQSSLLILEEPELFLHPHAKRMLSEILKDFVDTENNKYENQIILTSHSDEFISNVDIENINVIRKTQDGTKKSRINKAYYGDGKELQKLKIELQHKNAEMFFAEKVILVEGEEQILFPQIVHCIYGKDVLNNNDVSIIKVGGKSYFDIYRKVLNELKIDNYIIADYDIINNGLEKLLENDDKNALLALKSKIGEMLKKNGEIKKETASLDWNELVSTLDKMVENHKYDDKLNEKWEIFRQRIHQKKRLCDLPDELKKQVLAFITNMYDKRIFIMKNGELEDYYRKDNFDEELSNLSGKGIVAYKISELSQTESIENYIEIEEYKEIFSKILGKIPDDNTGEQILETES